MTYCVGGTFQALSFAILSAVEDRLLGASLLQVRTDENLTVPSIDIPADVYIMFSF